MLSRPISQILAPALSIFLFCVALPAQNTHARIKFTPDEQAIHDYVLTMDKVTAYMTVASKLIEQTATDGALNDEVSKIAAANVSNLKKVEMAGDSPHIVSFLKSNDMTPRDFVLTPLTLFSALQAVTADAKSKKTNSFVNSANVHFVLANMAQLKKYEQKPK